MIKIYLREEKANKIRREGKVPGVIYGPNIKSQKIYAEEKEIENLYKEHEVSLFEFDFEGQKLLGLLRDIQFHPLTYKIIHFDIYVPSLEKEVTSEIPLEFIGEAPVLKSGGVLNFSLKELPVEALPRDLPERIIVDLSSLKDIGQTIYVKDLQLPPQIKVLIEENTPVVTALPEAEIETETPVTKVEPPPTTNV